MPFSRRVGSVPDKRHTQYRRPEGALYGELGENDDRCDELAVMVDTFAQRARDLEDERYFLSWL
jgi:hypothetical protein